MQSRMVKRGFTLIELLVVIAIIAILASILFPVFAKAREKARQTTCLSGLRQMGTGIAIYIQDNSGRLPGKTWNTQIGGDGGVTQKMFFCPSASVKNDDGSEICYGYAAQLVRADGTGISEAQLKAPSEVGAICDAGPVSATGGLVGGGVTADATINVMTPDPRHAGVIAAFCDGHAKYFPGAYKDNSADLSSPVIRAFYLPTSLGLVDNFGGGIEFTTSPGITAKVRIGGDSAVQPILQAMAEAYKAKGGDWNTRGFLGSGNNLGSSSAIDYAWGYADGVTGGTTLGHDVLLVIVNKACKIPGIPAVSQPSESKKDEQVHVVDAGSIGAIMTYSGGYMVNSVQTYLFDTKNGSRTLFQAAGPAGYGITLTGNCKDGIVVATDQEMMEKVAADPYGIGFMSSAQFDPDKVRQVAIDSSQIWPSPNAKTRWQTGLESYSGWTGYRALTLVSAGTNGNTFVTWANANSASLRACPLFKATFLQ